MLREMGEEVEVPPSHRAVGTRGLPGVCAEDHLFAVGILLATKVALPGGCASRHGLLAC